MSRRTKLLLITAGAVVSVALLLLAAVNLLISADWVRDRVADRIKEQTGRDLTVNGSTTLLFSPGPHVVITDAAFVDPEARAGTTDFSVARMTIDLGLLELMSHNVDAERIVLEQPVLTLRLGNDDRREEAKKPSAPKPASSGDKPRRDVKLKDVSIEDGTVNIVYDAKGQVRRAEHITASFSMPTLTAPLTGSGKFNWKDQTVGFNFELTSMADLRDKRPARLQFALDNPALAARFDGSLTTRPNLVGQGELSAKAQSVPSLLAWMRQKPTAMAGIGEGELSSHVDWKDGEINFSNARFALEHASGQGQAVVTLGAPRPLIRAALALDHLDLNPFLAPGAKSAGSGAAPQAGGDAPQGAQAQAQQDADTGAQKAEAGAPVETQPSEAEAPDQQAAPSQSAPAPTPASFDADVNLNVRETRLFHLELGPSSVGFSFHDGVLNATLGGMELYGGQASGKFVLDASKPVPTFAGNFQLDGVQAKTLLSDAAQFSMLEGRTKLALQLNGAGGSTEEVKSSLTGQGNIVISDGAIEGINLTEMINSVGAGEMPDLRQGPGAKTAFNDLGGSFTIANGIAETNNLTATSPLLKVSATGTVNIPQGTIDLLANPEIVAGSEGKKGGNDLAGLSVPVRIEGPLDRATIRPEISGISAEQAGKAVNKIGEALQKKFKGKPVGEAIGRILGNVQIGTRGGNNGDAQGAPQGPAKKDAPQAKPNNDSGTDQSDDSEPPDPEIENLLR